MVERLRALLEAPLDPAVARAVVVLACAVTLGLAVVVGLGGLGGSGEASRPPIRPLAVAATSAQPNPSLPERSAVPHRAEPRQDPQDRRGSAARARAERELASHRALQHVPYRRGAVTISLVGTRGLRAVLRVEGPSVPVARRAWRAFLQGYRDDGEAYLPRFRVRTTVAHGAAHRAPHPAAGPAARPSAGGAAIPHPDADRRARDLPTSPRHLEVGP